MLWPPMVSMISIRYAMDVDALDDLDTDGLDDLNDLDTDGLDDLNDLDT